MTEGQKFEYAEVSGGYDNQVVKLLPINPLDGGLKMSTLISAFPGATGLEEENAKEVHEEGTSNAIPRVLYVSDTDNRAILTPYEGWQKKRFRAIYATESTKPTAMTRSGSRRPRLASEFNEEEWKVSACLKYLLYFESNGLKYCATVLNIKTAITCSHCLSKEAKPGDPIVLHDQDGKTYQASLMYINKAFDIAFLSLTESTGFGIEPLSPGGAYTGAPYMAFGYPLDFASGAQSKDPCMITGAIISGTTMSNVLYGHTGGFRGFSGGPVINSNFPRTLIGIVVAGRSFPKNLNTDNFLQEIFTHYSEAHVLTILPASTAKVMFEMVAPKPDVETKEC